MHGASPIMIMIVIHWSLIDAASLHVVIASLRIAVHVRLLELVSFKLDLVLQEGYQR